VRRTKQLLNICFTLDYPPLSDPSHQSGVLSAAYLAMRLPVLNSLLAPAATRKALLRDSDRGKNLQHIRNIASSLPATGKFIASFLHARYWAAAPKLPGFTLHSPTNVYALYYHAEQSAHHESRIELADTVDELGMPRAKVSLRFSPGDAESIVRAHEVLDAHLRSHDLGSLAYWYPEGERVDAVLRQATDGFHQIGTTRMADTPESGVTDSYGRVFGTRNLFVCSSSLFPTSGQANPTLTLLAYAIRQAEYLSRLLRR
jgi:choline dehydrogenase-like flavoprotein